MADNSFEIQLKTTVTGDGAAKVTRDLQGLNAAVKDHNSAMAELNAWWKATKRPIEQGVAEIEKVAPAQQAVAQTGKLSREQVLGLAGAITELAAVAATDGSVSVQTLTERILHLAGAAAYASGNVGLGLLATSLSAVLHALNAVSKAQDAEDARMQSAAEKAARQAAAVRELKQAYEDYIASLADAKHTFDATNDAITQIVKSLDDAIARQEALNDAMAGADIAETRDAERRGFITHAQAEETVQAIQERRRKEAHDARMQQHNVERDAAEQREQALQKEAESLAGEVGTARDRAAAAARAENIAASRDQARRNAEQAGKWNVLEDPLNLDKEKRAAATAAWNAQADKFQAEIDRLNQQFPGLGSATDELKAAEKALMDATKEGERIQREINKARQAAMDAEAKADTERRVNAAKEYEQAIKDREKRDVAEQKDIQDADKARAAEVKPYEEAKTAAERERQAKQSAAVAEARDITASVTALEKDPAFQAKDQVGAGKQALDALVARLKANAQDSEALTQLSQLIQNMTPQLGGSGQQIVSQIQSMIASSQGLISSIQSLDAKVREQAAQIARLKAQVDS